MNKVPRLYKLAFYPDPMNPTGYNAGQTFLYNRGQEKAIRQGNVRDVDSSIGRQQAILNQNSPIDINDPNQVGLAKYVQGGMDDIIQYNKKIKQQIQKDRVRTQQMSPKNIQAKQSTNTSGLQTVVPNNAANNTTNNSNQPDFLQYILPMLSIPFIMMQMNNQNRPNNNQSATTGIQYGYYG